MAKKTILFLLCIIETFLLTACSGFNIMKNEIDSQRNSDLLESTQNHNESSISNKFSDTDLLVLIDGNESFYAKHNYGGMEYSLTSETIVNTAKSYANKAEKKENQIQVSFLKEPTSVRFSYILSVKNAADVNNLDETDILTWGENILSKCETSDDCISLSFNSPQVFNDSKLVIIVLHGYYSDNIDYEYYIGVKF